MEERLKDIIQYCHSDQLELNERGINLNIDDVVKLSMMEMNDRLKKMNLSPKDSIFIKRLRRKIRNRVSSQNARKRTRERIFRLQSEISAVKECKKTILNDYNVCRTEYEQLREKTTKLYMFLMKNLEKKNEETKMPFELSEISHLEMYSFKTIKKEINNEKKSHIKLKSNYERIPKYMICKTSHLNSVSNNGVDTDSSCDMSENESDMSLSGLVKCEIDDTLDRKSAVGTDMSHPFIRQLLEARSDILNNKSLHNGAATDLTDIKVDISIVKREIDDMSATSLNDKKASKTEIKHPLIRQLLCANPAPMNNESNNLTAKRGINYLIQEDEKMAEIIQMESDILKLAMEASAKSKKRKQATPRRVVKDMDQSFDLRCGIKEEPMDS